MLDTEDRTACRVANGRPRGRSDVCLRLRRQEGIRDADALEDGAVLQILGPQDVAATTVRSSSMGPYGRTAIDYVYTTTIGLGGDKYSQLPHSFRGETIKAAATARTPRGSTQGIQLGYYQAP